MKKIIRIGTVLSILLLGHWQLQAQRLPAGPPHRGPALEHFSEALDLSETQKTEMKTLHESQRAEVKALMDTAFENPEERRQAMKTLRETHQKAMDDILTEAQKEKLATLKAEAREKRKEHRRANVEKHKALRTEIRNYRETNILPVLKEQRTKLEEVLSAQDKATIAGLRAKHEAQKRKREDFRPGERRQRPEWSDEQKAAMRAEREKIKALVEKYDSEISGLLADIETEREDWKEDMKKIGEKYAPEHLEEYPADKRKMNGKNARERMGRRSGRSAPGVAAQSLPRRFMGGEMGKAGFLLLDPNAENAPAATPGKAFAEVQVFPNPSASRNTIKYNLKESGHYRVELRDKDGLVLQVISKQYRQTGDYQEEVDLSAYAAGTYYVSIIGAEGVISKKVVIAK